MKKYGKALFAMLMAFVMTFSFALSVSASENDLIYTLEIDGIEYAIREAHDSQGNKMVKVVGNGEEITVLNDSEFLNINVSDVGSAKTRTLRKNYVIEIQEEQVRINTRGSAIK